jgi:hypothetical protein
VTRLAHVTTDAHSSALQHAFGFYFSTVYSHTDNSRYRIVDLPIPLDVGQADLVQGSWYPHRLVVLVDDSRSDAFLEVGPWDTDGVTGVCLVQGLV